MLQTETNKRYRKCKERRNMECLKTSLGTHFGNFAHVDSPDQQEDEIVIVKAGSTW
jgi:hypothetical protein